MGFFSGFINTFKKVGKALDRAVGSGGIVKLAKAIPKIKVLKLAVNVAKFGPVAGSVNTALAISHPKIGKIHNAALETTFKVASSAFLTPAASRALNTAADFATAAVNRPPPTPRIANGGQNMAFDIGGFVGKVGDIFKGSSLPAFQNIGGVASLASNFIPRASGRPPVAVTARPAGLVATPAMASVPAVAGAAGRAMVSRGFFSRFPNLATAIQSFRNTGRANITRKKLYGALKRFGPEMLVSGGILTAAAVSELAVAGPGTKRMNPANVKALRRSVRRMESFHRLCVKVDKLRSRGRVKHARR